MPFDSHQTEPQLQRQPAPGDLAAVERFINSVDLESGVDALSTPARLASWLVDRGWLPLDSELTAAEWRRALDVREALRALAGANSGQGIDGEALATLAAAAEAAQLRLRFGGAGSALLPAADGFDGALGRLLVIVHHAMGEGTWRRMKSCRAASCRWVFYDASKNRSGAWCDMAICGNRAKTRAYRKRLAGSG